MAWTRSRSADVRVLRIGRPGRASTCPKGGSPTDARRSGASLGSPAAPAQVSHPASVTCTVSDRRSAKILNERGYPLRPLAPARTRPVADLVGQPGRANRRGLASGPWQSPASVRRPAACDS